MITDPIFYRLFETSPETFFLILGMSPDSARQTAARYRYEALEFKATAHRTDGVFRPTAPGLPLYFLEVQFYPLPSVFADLVVKAYTFLKQHDPGQMFCGVVLFASRTLEPKDTAPYEPLFSAGLILRFYLDELAEVENAPMGLSILYLLRRSEEQVPTTARELVARVKTEIDDEALRTDLVELIETVIMGKLPRLTREEIQVMLQIHDIRKSRVYQEALEEGIEVGIEKGIEQGIEKGIEQGIEKGIEKGIEQGIEQGIEKERQRSILQLAARKMSAEDIAECLGLNVKMVRKALSKPRVAVPGGRKKTGQQGKQPRTPD